MSNDASWAPVADALRAAAVEHAAKFDPDSFTSSKKAEFEKAEILGWKLQLMATEVAGPKGSGRMWGLSASRPEEPDEACVRETRELLMRLGAGEPFCSGPVSRGLDQNGDVAWTWMWNETLSIRAAPDAASGHRKVGRNEPCPCGSGVKFKKCCAGSAN